MKTYEQAEMERRIEIQLLVKKLEIDALNTRNAASLSTKSLFHYLITKKMIAEDVKKSIQDCDIHTSEGNKKLKELHKSLMYRMDPLFRHEPRLKKICKDKNSKLVLSCFTKYACWASSDETLNDLEYVIQFCGYNLTCLKVFGYPFNSQIMQLIHTNCPGLKELAIKIEEINDQDFENVFSNMHKLEDLSILWKCGKSTLPMTLVKSLEKVGGNLKDLALLCRSKDDVFLPDSLAPVFPRFTALERLRLDGFQLNQTVIQSIGETESITDLELLPLGDHPMINEKINMSPIGNLKNLKSLDIRWNCGDSDELLIKLRDNAEKLKELHILGTNITDNGIFAVTKMSQLQGFHLCLDDFAEKKLEKRNKYITDKSIECLFNEQLRYLDLSNCRKVSNRSVIKLFENLPNLSFLAIRNTSVNIKVVEELSKLTKCHEKKVHVDVSFKDRNSIFKSLYASHNIKFERLLSIDL